MKINIKYDHITLSEIHIVCFSLPALSNTPSKMNAKVVGTLSNIFTRYVINVD